MLSSTSSTSSLFLPEEEEEGSVSIFESESYVPKHPYYTRLAARRASTAFLTNSSFVTTKSTVNPRRHKLILQPARMDWTGPKTCRPGYFYTLSKFATSIIAIGVLGMAVAYLNERIRHSYHPVADMTTDIHELQHQVIRMREILEGRADKGGGYVPPQRDGDIPMGREEKGVVDSKRQPAHGKCAPGAKVGEVGDGAIAPVDELALLRTGETPKAAPRARDAARAAAKTDERPLDVQRQPAAPSARDVDAQGRPIGLGGEGALGQPTTADAAGRPVDAKGIPLTKDAQGRLVDSDGRPVAVDSQGHVVSLDAQGRPVDAQGRVIGPDAQGRPITIDANGRLVDGQGRPVVLDAQGRPIVVDAQGRPLEVGAGAASRPTDADGRSSTAGRPVDAQGRPIAEDAQGRPIDADGRPVALDAQGRVFTVDAQGRAVDAQGRPVGPDAQGRPITVDAKGRLIDADGRPVILDAQGRVVDAQGRPFEAQRGSIGDDTQSRPIDAQRRPTPVDAQGRPITEDAQGRPTDADGRPVAVDAHGHVFTLDAQGRAVDAQGRPVGPDALGRPITVDAKGRLVDADGRPVILDDKGRPVDAQGRPVDTQGRPITVDAQGRPIDADGRPLALDAQGRIVSLDAQGRPVDAAGRPLGPDAKGRPFTIDANGRLIDGDGRPVVLDAQGRPLVVGEGADTATQAAMQGGAGDAFGAEIGRRDVLGEAATIPIATAGFVDAATTKPDLQQGRVPVGVAVGESGGATEGGGIFVLGIGNQYPNNVGDALNQFSADKTGMKDFALESAGGAIIALRATENYNDYAKFTLLGFTICDGANGPRAMIQGSVLPGECWAFKGKTGTAVIRLLGRVKINGVSLEHISKDTSPTGEISSAPKEFSISGLKGPYDQDGSVLGRFKYDVEGPTIQRFPVKESEHSFQYIEFKVHSNHGNEDYTCVYRLRVHGTLDQASRVRT